MLARTALGASLALVCLFCAPLGASAHHASDGAAEHIAEDSVIHTPAEEASLQRQTAAATRDDAAAAATAVAGDEHLVGQWGPVNDWPVVGVHVALLPNGKVLAYDSVGDHATETYPVHDFTRATVWDPATGSHTRVDLNTGHNIFCSGLAHLPDGSLFLAGGNKDSALNGIKQTHTFNPSTNSWSLGADMEYERWYPSVTPLSNGEMLITEGGPDTPEVRETNGGLRQLDGAALGLPLYPWLDVAPNGRVFYSGPTERMRSLNPAGSGAWQTFALRGDGINRDYGSHAVYDIGKTLVAGGGLPPSETARVIDVNGTTPQASTTDSMQFKRRQHNLTVLADGSVLATGGLSSNNSLVDLENGVYAAERWDPANGQWSTLAAMHETRQYHSTALLLPDGRVLSSGGGICGACDDDGYLAKNAQVFTPPYLFNNDGSGTLAPRPTISSPGVVNYGAPLQISTPNAATIGKVGLVRLGAVTHSVDMEQRYIPLSFSRGSGMLTATGPANPNIAPPGPYMLFAINTAGVPSIAEMVTVTTTNPPPSVSLTQPANEATFTAPATVDFVATASDNGSVSRVEFYNGSTKLGEDTTSPYTFTWPDVAAGTYTLSARAIDNAGAATTSDARTITVEPANLSPVAVLDASPTSGSAPLTVSFSGGRSSDLDGDSLSYSWSFGDGGTSSGAVASHRYSNPGTYTARLTVSDDRGGTDTDTATISVGTTPAMPPVGDPWTPPGTPSLPNAPPSSGGPAAADITGPKLRLLAVNAARGRIRGSAADKSSVGEVSVALRRKVRGGGCSWWLEGKRQLSAGRRPCDKPRWIDARLTSASGGVRWLLKLGRALPPGNYRVLVRAVDGKGNEARLSIGPSSITRVARR